MSVSNKSRSKISYILRAVASGSTQQLVSSAETSGHHCFIVANIIATYPGPSPPALLEQRGYLHFYKRRTKCYASQCHYRDCSSRNHQPGCRSGLSLLHEWPAAITATLALLLFCSQNTQTYRLQLSLLHQTTNKRSIFISLASPYSLVLIDIHR